MENKILRLETINKDAILDIVIVYRQKLNSINIRDTNQSMGIMKISFIDSFFINKVPHSLKIQTRKLIKLIKFITNYVFDKYGYLSIKDGGKMLR